jgi:hypothetical protein
VIIKKCILVIISLLLVDCKNIEFREKIIESLSSGNYVYIINNSDDDVAERFQRALNNRDKYFDKAIYYIKTYHLYGNKFNMVLKEENGREINVQYKKEKGRNIIFYIDIEHQDVIKKGCQRLGARR